MTLIKNVIKLLTPLELKGLLILLGMTFIGMFMEMLGVGLVIPVIGLLVQENLATSTPFFNELYIFFGSPSKKSLIMGTLLALVGVFLIKNVFIAVMIWLQARFISNLQADMSQRLFTIYLRQPYTFHLQHNSSELIRNVGGEVTMLGSGIIAPGIQLITEGLVLLGIFTLLMLVEPIGTLVIGTVLGIASLSFYRLTKRYVSKWGETRQYHDGMRTQHLYQGLGGAKEVKLLGRESDFVDKYAFHTDMIASVNKFQTTLQQLPRLWLELLAVTALASLILIMLVQDGETNTILPTLGLFAAAAFRLMPSISRMINSLQQIRFSLPVVTTLYHELLLDSPESNTKKIKVRTEFNKSVCISDVNYTYPGSSCSSLKNISLSINKGDSIGIIGPSGSGKSTLIDVILGLLTPSSGTIIVDRQNIQNNIRSWQDNIGYVSQSIYLTDDTLRRNVAFGLADDEINDKAVTRAIKDAQLEKFVTELPNALETIVGEHGVRLSGGQRQRIGIARALYHDPSVLVLDEATSALDTQTEVGVMQAIKELRGKKTILIVAHRLSTVNHCNKLYRIENGEIAEEGSPSTMLKTS